MPSCELPARRMTTSWMERGAPEELAAPPGVSGVFGLTMREGGNVFSVRRRVNGAKRALGRDKNESGRGRGTEAGFMRRDPKVEPDVPIGLSGSGTRVRFAVRRK